MYVETLLRSPKRDQVRIRSEESCRSIGKPVPKIKKGQILKPIIHPPSMTQDRAGLVTGEKEPGSSLGRRTEQVKCTQKQKKILKDIDRYPWRQSSTFKKLTVWALGESKNFRGCPKFCGLLLVHVWFFGIFNIVS